MTARGTLNSEKTYISEFVKYLQYEKQYTQDTLVNYKIDLKQFSQYLKNNNFNIDDVSKDNIEQFFMNLHKLGISASSLARKASTLRSFYS